MHLSEPRMISIGNHRSTRFPAGYYVYVGSALGGIEARVNRHLRNVKKLRWHIDYLLAETPIIEVTAGETKTRAECAVARTLGSQFEAIPDFGSGDCRCPSHLFLAPDDRQLSAAVQHALESAGIKPELWKTRTGGK
jgi:Uri superfamily endonuclease